MSPSPATATTSGWRFRSRMTFSTTRAVEAVTGKPIGHDLRERKVTLPLVVASGARRTTTEESTRSGRSSRSPTLTED